MQYVHMPEANMMKVLDELGINAEGKEPIGLARINVIRHYSDSSARNNVSQNIFLNVTDQEHTNTLLM